MLDKSLARQRMYNKKSAEKMRERNARSEGTKYYVREAKPLSEGV